MNRMSIPAIIISVMFVTCELAEAMARQFTYAYLPNTLDELTDVSDFVVEADVAKIIPPAANQEPGWTDIAVNVRRVLKGRESNQSFLVSFSRLEFALGSATLHPGDRYVMFLKSMRESDRVRLPHRDGLSRYVSNGGSLGPFRVDGDRVYVSDNAFINQLKQLDGTSLSGLESQIYQRLNTYK